MKDKEFWTKHFGHGKTPQVYRDGAAGVLIDKSLSDAEKHAAIDALEDLLPTAKGVGGTGWMRDMAAGSGGGQVVTEGAPRTGRETAPLAFAESDLHAMGAAVVGRQTLRIKAFSSLDTALPAQLSPQVIGPVHENRLLDRLPTQAIGARSYEYIRHSSTTGAAAVVAEGAPKPEIVLNTDTLTATAQKIARTLPLRGRPSTAGRTGSATCRPSCSGRSSTRRTRSCSARPLTAPPATSQGCSTRRAS